MKKLFLLCFILSFFQLAAFSQSCLPEGIIFSTQAQIDNFQVTYPGCRVIEGNVIISGDNITNLNGISVVTSIMGSLIIGDESFGDNDNLATLTGLDSVTSIGGELMIYNNDLLNNLNGLAGLTFIGTSLTILGNNILNSLAGLEGLTSIQGDVEISGSPLTDMTGLAGLTNIEGDFEISGSSTLTSMTGLEELTSVGGELWISNNSTLTSLTGLNNINLIGEDLVIDGNDGLINLMGLEGVTSIGGYLSINDNGSLTSMLGLEGLTSIGALLYIYDNQNLTSLSGLDNLNSIEGELQIAFNQALTNLTGLESLNSIEGWLRIEQNQSLKSLSGIDNLDAGSIINIEISGNDSLSSCEVQSVCDNLANPRGKVIIYNNADGCNNPSEVTNACGFTLLCLPYGDYYLLSQSDIDNFQTLYPGCDTLEGEILISGEDITNLNGLNSVTAIGVKLVLYNNISLTNLSGLEGITFIGGGLWIIYNDILTSLAGLDNFNTDSMLVLDITDNYSLTTCDIQSVCNFITNPKPNGDLVIYNNASGCATEAEVEAACGVGLKEIADPGYCSVYPNPFTNQTTFTIRLQEPAKVNQMVFNNMGQVVATILDGPFDIGEHQIIWNAEGLKPGIYFYRLTAGNQAFTGKMMMVR